VDLIRWSRPLAWLVATAAIVVAAWLLFVPITVAYVTSDADPAPRDVSTLYSWWTSEQDLIYSDITAADLNHLDEDAFLSRDHLAEGFRLNCGNAFTAGLHEQLQQPDGARVCSGVEGSRRIISSSMLGLGVLGLWTAIRLPANRDRNRTRYHQPYRQRRLLKRGK
jgi:hypothetical protein